MAHFQMPMENGSLWPINRSLCERAEWRMNIHRRDGTRKYIYILKKGETRSYHNWLSLKLGEKLMEFGGFMHLMKLIQFI